MRASDLKDRIEIYEAVKQRTESGAISTTYRYKCSCRARVNYSSGSKTPVNDQIFYDVNRVFIVRHYVPVVDTDRIMYDNKTWEILSIDHDHSFHNIVINSSLLPE